MVSSRPIPKGRARSSKRTRIQQRPRLRAAASARHRLRPSPTPLMTSAPGVRIERIAGVHSAPGAVLKCYLTPAAPMRLVCERSSLYSAQRPGTYSSFSPSPSTLLLGLKAEGPALPAFSRCPRDVPEPPSIASDRHQQQAMNLELTRGLTPRATHGNPLVMRRSSVRFRWAAQVRGRILLVCSEFVARPCRASRNCVRRVPAP